MDFGVAGERGAYLVLEYVPGPTLREALQQGPLARERVAVFARQLGEALQAEGLLVEPLLAGVKPGA